MDFANVLFGGPCNRRCHYCIGKSLPDRVNVNNLNMFPPRGIDRFVDEVNARGISEIVFTGTTTDPQMYRHEVALLDLLRSRIAGARYSVHTNGALALKKMDSFNHYDRACISFPSFCEDIYERHMGSRSVPDLERILAHTQIPVKISCVLDADNAPSLSAFVARCHAIGVRRVVLRKLFGDTRTWAVPLERVGSYRGNRVYDYRGMEVTFWDFDVSTSTSVNLFADGSLGDQYLLVESVARGV